jgi:serine/threonine protein kinase
MGEVYLARDTKLNRPVAIKLLSAALSRDADRLRRFRQEAHSVSALNHPNILVIHDFGDANGRPFMVTEYVEGQTLRQRMQTPLPIEEAIDIALQVGKRAGRAHARGIVHRDVKPENVMLRPDGYVKVLDFGLAKLGEGPSTDLRSTPITTPGIVMGTPRYMSPEQARGLELDARSDVWSLGVVIYEMVAGAPPFAGVTSADLTAAILNAEPVPLELKAPHVPTALARLTATALRKSRLERFATGLELVTELMAIEKQLDQAPPRQADLGPDPDTPGSGVDPAHAIGQAHTARRAALPNAAPRSGDRVPWFQSRRRGFDDAVES